MCHRQVIVCTHRSVSIKTLTEKVQSVCHSYNFQRTKAYHRHHKHLENSSSPSFLLFPIFLLQVTNKYSARKSKRNSFLVFAVGFVLFGILAIAQYLISNVCHNQCTLLLCFGCILELSLQCKGNLNRKAAVSMIGPEDVCLKFFYIWDNHEHFFLSAYKTVHRGRKCRMLAVQCTQQVMLHLEGPVLHSAWCQRFPGTWSPTLPA